MPIKITNRENSKKNPIWVFILDLS
jgi:hypothetical protein